MSNDGDIYETQKSNIVSLLEDFCDVECSQPQTEGMLIEGFAICLFTSSSKWYIC